VLIASLSLEIFSPLVLVEIEAAWSLLFHLLFKLNSQKKISELILRSVSAISESTEKGPVRLRCLTILFNKLDNTIYREEKLSLFETIIKFSAASKQLELLYPYLLNAASWKNAWGLSLAQTRHFYLVLSQAFTSVDNRDVAQSFLTRYLATFEGEDVSTCMEAQKAAVDACINFVRSATPQSTSLPSLAAVKVLATVPEHARLHALASIVATGTLSDYQKFESQHPGYAESLGVNSQVAESTMRLLTLVSLSSQETELSYSTVSSALQVSLSVSWDHHVHFVDELMNKSIFGIPR
jgi:hypothetical protein